MRASRTFILALSICIACLPLAAVADTTRPFVALKKDFRKALKSKDPKVRMNAFDVFKDCRDPLVVGEIIYGVEKAQQDMDKVRKTQAAAQDELSALQNKLEKAKADFDRSNKDSNAMASFNKKARKISKSQDAAKAKMERLENDWTRARSMIQRGCNVMALILKEMPDTALETALIDLDTLWLNANPKRKPNGPIYWLDSVREVKRKPVSAAMHIVVDDAVAPMSIRVAVIGALAERDDGLMLGKALKMLKLPMDRAPLITAAIYAIRRMHDKRGIKPLIDFLKREDLKRLREDAHVALQSLTGQKQIGPYNEPWADWFREEGMSFTMPKSPMPPGMPIDDRDGVTFYGIHTFSDRVLFIVDISGSMAWALKGPRGVEATSDSKMDMVRKELSGAVFNLNPGEHFNVILFNHDVIPWQKNIVKVSPTTQNQLKRWIYDMKPVGLTNIHDALEAGFRVATRTTGEIELDTIFFLTDGQPTHGKVQDPKKILEAVREWNEVANLRIHVIGIGDHTDKEFLQELAQIGDGKYVQR